MNNKTFSIPKSNISINNNYTVIDGFQQAIYAATSIESCATVKTNFATTNTVRYFKEGRSSSFDLYPLDSNPDNYIKINEKTEIYISLSLEFNGEPHFIGFVFEKSAEEVCSCGSCGAKGYSPLLKRLCDSCGGNGYLVNCNLVAVKPRFYIKQSRINKNGKIIYTYKRSTLNLTKKQIDAFIEKISTKLNIDTF